MKTLLLFAFVLISGLEFARAELDPNTQLNHIPYGTEIRFTKDITIAAGASDVSISGSSISYMYNSSNCTVIRLKESMVHERIIKAGRSLFVISTAEVRDDRILGVSIKVSNPQVKELYCYANPYAKIMSLKDALKNFATIVFPVPEEI